MGGCHARQDDTRKSGMRAANVSLHAQCTVALLSILALCFSDFEMKIMRLKQDTIGYNGGSVNITAAVT